MAVERTEIELLCSANCPFGRECGQNYADEEPVCLESVDSTIDAINSSFVLDPVLDPERPTRKYSDVRKEKIIYTDEVPITVTLKMKTKHGTIQVRFGQIEQGKVKVYAYSKEIYERIKNTAPVIKRG